MPEQTMIATLANGNPIPAAEAHITTQDTEHTQEYYAPWALTRLPVQRKLAIGAVDDPLEREADSMADKVMRMPIPSFIQRKCAHCEEEKKAQRKPLAAFIQKKGTEGNSYTSNAVASQIQATKGSGSTLLRNTKSFMESRFGADFSRVRLHTGDYAAQMSTELNAQAFTVGNDIYFNAGKFSPETSSGQYLLAHELTHTIQQRGGDTAIRRFGSDEHRRMGDSAVGGHVFVTAYGRFSFGEMVAMAGDYFESVDEIARLAESGNPTDREQIEYVLWKVNPTRPMPVVSESAIAMVMNRYYRLAAANETHFSTGGTLGNSNRARYISLHMNALNEAFAEGRNPVTPRRWTWQTTEGFAQHYLTDAFSAGHVRTERGNIQRHWNGLYPNFTNNLVSMISCYMAAHINARDAVGYFSSVDGLATDIAPVIRGQAGNVLSAFSIGDLISIVLHDADNAGLDVVSPRGPAGTTFPSPFHWRAVGDENLFPRTGTASTAQQQTQQMMSEAMFLSHDEGRQAYTAGISNDISTLARLTDLMNFRALSLIPSEDTSSTTNPVYVWRAANLAALPTNIQALITAAFLPDTEIRKELDALAIPCITPASGFDLHTRDAFLCFKQKLLADVWGTIQEIAAGGTALCPPGQNDFCPTLRNSCQPSAQLGGH
ncbi:DUF4157 domain-containing protein [Chitinophaga agrisoli]|uniref:DUF4157 domain-containing protein n=1 Tax=Chitinophaga agrisoli TaxID=2607653 RepID=A0A5B2VM54_9BACT|nr:DUF4157 domain-containing protein [Chitinophaga agrisoli]KAA2239289.1 DUF4157 domain-containing protein [Chitinophaga agrisoli]